MVKTGPAGRLCNQSCLTFCCFMHNFCVCWGSLQTPFFGTVLREIMYFKHMISTDQLLCVLIFFFNKVANILDSNQKMIEYNYSKILLFHKKKQTGFPCHFTLKNKTLYSQNFLPHYFSK